MKGVAVWLRLAWPTFPVFILLEVVSLLRGPGWSSSWLWMVSVVNGSTMLISPAAAAATALLVVRGWPAELRRDVAPGAAFRGCVHLAGAVWIYAATVLLVGFSVGSIVCAATGAHTGDISWPMQPLSGFVALIPAVLVGVVAAILSQSILTIPTVFLLVFVIHPILWMNELPQFYAPDLPTVDMVGFRLAPVRLGLELVGNVALGLVELAVARFIVEAAEPRRRWGSLLALSVVAVALTIWGVLAWPTIYELTE